ncbi:MAG: NAD-binding protein [Chloroflexota bacterium]
MLAYLSILFKPLREFTNVIVRSGLGLSLFPILILVGIGTILYSLFEGWSLLDSLYATIITVTTIGYGDLSPQTPGGRIFAIFFSLTAIGLASYAISTLAAVVIDFQTDRIARSIREKRMNKIVNLKDHMIICGATIVGHRTAADFVNRGIPFILIEKDEQRLKWAMLWLHEGYVSKRQQHFKNLDIVDFSAEEDKSIDELASETGTLYLHEDPTDEQQLRIAGIERARGLVAAMPDDRDNISIILSAREMVRILDNERLRIVSLASDEWNIRRIYLAGADQVTSTNMVGGYHIASQMVSPELGQFWNNMLFRKGDHGDVRFDDFHIEQNSKWLSRPAGEFSDSQNQNVVAIKRAEHYIYNPDPNETLKLGDVLIIFGKQN